MPDSEKIWIQAERKHAEDYLQEQQVDHLGVGELPAFHVYPYLALWAVQSKSSRGNIGWWVITGDLPADYIPSREARHPREALKSFSMLWKEASEFMLRGQEHPDFRIGKPDQWPELGDLLRRRSEIILQYVNDEEIWTEE